VNETSEEMFWRLVRDGYPYEQAQLRRASAELDELRRELIARGGQP
jgi:hypothetical protein